MASAHLLGGVLEGVSLRVPMGFSKKKAKPPPIVTLITNDIGFERGWYVCINKKIYQHNIFIYIYINACIQIYIYIYTFTDQFTVGKNQLFIVT